MIITGDDCCEVLRVIASEARLSSDDKASLLTAAEQLEFAQRDLIATYAKLIETQQRLIAVNDQLIEARKAPAPDQLWSLSSGWVKAQ